MREKAVLGGIGYMRRMFRAFSFCLFPVTQRHGTGFWEIPLFIPSEPIDE